MSKVRQIVEAIVVRQSFHDFSLELLSVNGPIEFKDVDSIAAEVLRKAKNMMELEINDYTFIANTGIEYKITLLNKPVMK